MEARIAKPEKTMTISYYWVANFKLDEINTEFKVENRKKTLTIALYDIAKNMRKKKKLLNMQKYYVEKA